MTSNEYSNPDILVSTAWLENHIDEPDIRVVDCDMMDSYARAHIKGSVGIDVHHYIKHPNYPSDNKAYPWVAGPEVVKDIFQRMGIGDETTVVAYDSNGSLWATRFWWVLNYYGHMKVKVLDGGWKKWFDENRPLSIDIPTIKETMFTPEIKLGLICEIDEMSSKLGNEDTIFLDVRSDSEWDGTNDRGNLRSGRIPGSVHLEWLNFVEADKYQTFKTVSELRRMLSDLGVTSEKEVITY